MKTKDFPVNQAKVQEALDRCPGLRIAVNRFRRQLNNATAERPGLVVSLGGINCHTIVAAYPEDSGVDGVAMWRLLNEWAEYQFMRSFMIPKRLLEKNPSIFFDAISRDRKFYESTLGEPFDANPAPHDGPPDDRRDPRVG